MRRAVAVVVAIIVAACGGTPDTTPTTVGGLALERAAAAYSASAMRAIDGTAFDVLAEDDLAGIIVGLCEGLGVGAIGVAAADTGVTADEAEVAIFLEVLRTGLDQLCEERVVVDLTAIYLTTIEGVVESGGATAVYDEIAAIRAAPIVCAALDDAGAEPALLEAGHTLFGIEATSAEELAASIDESQGLVIGAVLAAATALLCPEHLDALEGLTGSL